MFAVHSKRAMSIAEVMAVIVILSFGLVGTLKLVDSGIKLATTTENRIQAINLAREGIEAVENIRNTNWLKFSSDVANCFDVKDYNAGCVGGGGHVKLYDSGPYVLINQNGLWYLTGTVSTWSGVTYDGKGLSMQGGNPSLSPCRRGSYFNCKSAFTRQIRITKEVINGNASMVVRSTVQWRDASRATPYDIVLETTFTNWKKNLP